MIKMKVKLEERGIINGWANWPWNFDPVWLRSCNGFGFVDEACKKCTRSAACLPVGKDEFKHKPKECPYGAAATVF